MDKALCLAVGSLAGGFARWAMSEAIAQRTGGRFPFGTLAVNLLGCLLIGVFHGLGESRLGAQGRMLLMVGLCGAFTTFSTAILEGSTLVDRGDWRSALTYLAASVVLGFALFRAGAAATRLEPAPVRAIGEAGLE